MDRLLNIRTIRIEWGDCDPAGIVYYPRYFEIFDNSTTALFELALGMRKHDFLKAYDIAGYPMVDTRARFFIPVHFSEDVVIETMVSEFRRSSFDVHHRLLKQGQLAAEGHETRVWVARVPGEPDKIKSRPIPQSVIDLFKSSSAAQAHPFGGAPLRT